MPELFISPCDDYVFKLIFGDQRNADIVADFLQAILPDIPAEDYEALMIIDPNVKPESREDKAGVLDVKLRLKSGKIIDIEIQVESKKALRSRIEFYQSKMLVEQIGLGENYEKIQRVINIVIVNFDWIKRNPSYLHRYRMCDVETGEEFSDLREINILELPKVPRTKDGSDVWTWAEFLKAKDKDKEKLKMLAETKPMIRIF